MKKTAIIMRGIPGSGKSSHAHDLTGPHGAIHSTDDYFVGRDGLYHFEPRKLRENHAKNLAAFKRSLEQGLDPVVCDNTNTQYWEYKPYVEAAWEAGYQVTVAEVPHIDSELAAQRNSHGVPVEAIERMLERWQETPPYLTVERLDYAPASASKSLYANRRKNPNILDGFGFDDFDDFDVDEAEEPDNPMRDLKRGSTFQIDGKGPVYTVTAKVDETMVIANRSDRKKLWYEVSRTSVTDLAEVEARKRGRYDGTVVASGQITVLEY